MWSSINSLTVARSIENYDFRISIYWELRFQNFQIWNSAQSCIFVWSFFSHNPSHLYLGRFKVDLVLQETCCSSQVLKTRRLVQETSKEKLFIKSRQIARHYWDLMWNSINSSTVVQSIENYNFRISIYWELRFQNF